MKKLVLFILFVIISYSNYFAQSKPFGYRISGNGEIVSGDFHIENGCILDSVTTNRITYRFEYNSDNKLSRDINITTYRHVELVNGRYITTIFPGYRDYYYNENGNVDSIFVRYWNDSLNAWENNLSYSIWYSYDEDGKLLSKKYSNRTSIEKYNYDSTGKLIASNTIDGSDTISLVREFDSQNRLTLIKRMLNGIVNGEQHIYKYDSTGNINLLMQRVENSTTSNTANFYLEFDELGRASYEIVSDGFLADSTWRNKRGFAYKYDADGRIIEMGPYTWFRYNSDGNLDSMIITHIVTSGYLSKRETFVDAYGNKITIPEYKVENLFYYSSGKPIAGIITNKKDDKAYSLSQNYPNPFNPATTITYSLPKNSFVLLKVYDLLGREITTLVNETKRNGTYKVTWEAQNVPSGVYFYSITAGDYSKTNKMIFLK